MMKRRRKILPRLLNAINPYHWITWLRNRAFDFEILYSDTFKMPVICVGNITVGGTGKTPHTEYLINLLKNDFRVAMLSRGYGRKTSGYKKAGPDTKMQEIGDEPFQIMRKFPDITVVVDESRSEGIRLLNYEKQPPEVFILDDAFQHRYVEAGLNILLVDHSRPIWDDCVLPFGRMRESIAAAKRADIVIITKCPPRMSMSEQEFCEKEIRRHSKAAVLYSTMKYGSLYPIFTENAAAAPSINEQMDILLVTGIANPAPLKAELEQRGGSVTLMQYADHHDFKQEELQEIATAFLNIKNENKAIITTEKDAARLVERTDIPEEIKNHIYALPIEVSFLNNESTIFNQIISDYVRENSTDSRIFKG